MGCVLTMPVLL